MTPPREGSSVVLLPKSDRNRAAADPYIHTTMTRCLPLRSLPFVHRGITVVCFVQPL